MQSPLRTCAIISISDITILDFVGGCCFINEIQKSTINTALAVEASSFRVRNVYKEPSVFAAVNLVMPLLGPVPVWTHSTDYCTVVRLLLKTKQVVPGRNGWHHRIQRRVAVSLMVATGQHTTSSHQEATRTFGEGMPTRQCNLPPFPLVMRGLAISTRGVSCCRMIGAVRMITSTHEATTPNVQQWNNQRTRQA